MLEVQEVDTYYGHIQALSGVSLHVEEGEIVALIGSNGAGKTTLLSTISGLVPARRGQVLFEGTEITHLPAEEIVGLGISHVPERRQVFAGLTVRDNLILGAYTRARRGEKKAVQSDLERVYELFPALGEREKQAAGTLSGGEQQMLAVGRGLMAQPKLLMLDEPSLGLAPLLVQEIFRSLVRLQEEGATILLVEQNARAALRVAHRCYVLETGHVGKSGTPEELMQDETVQQAYLGQGSPAADAVRSNDG